VNLYGDMMDHDISVSKLIYTDDIK